VIIATSIGALLSAAASVSVLGPVALVCFLVVPMGPAGASEFAGEGLELALEEAPHRSVHTGAFRAAEDLDSRLVEAHERTQAHAPRKEDGHAVVSEVVHGGEAAALFVGHAWQGAHLGNQACLDVNDGVQLAVAEVGPNLRLKAARETGRDGDACFAHETLQNGNEMGTKGSAALTRIGEQHPQEEMVAPLDMTASGPLV
jgi:hypothetical protein